jgi:ATP-binding cassette, subfamily B, bacterial
MKPIFQIISFTKIFRAWYIIGAIFVIAISLLSLVSPLVSKQIVDMIVGQIKGVPQDYHTLIIFLTIIIVSDVCITVLTAFGQWIGDLLAAKLQTYLANKFFEHLLRLDIGFYDNEITGRLTNKMYRGIQSITDFIQSMLNNFLPFFLTAIVTIILLAVYSPIIALLLTVLFPLYILISHKSSMEWQIIENEKNTIQDTSQGRVFEAISGIRVVKAFAAELHELKNFLIARKKIESLNTNQSKTWHYYDFLRRLSLNIILFAIYSYIIYQTFHTVYSIGEMTLLLQLVNQARFPLFAMSFILGQIQQASAGSKEFFALLDTPSKILDKPNAHDLVIEKNQKVPMIVFDHVTFAYEKTRTILHDITFSISHKQKFALVGESGQGKSTLVNLILRYYEPTQGIIKISGQDVTGVTQSSLRKNIAVVFQESLLFSGTIEENIRYGKQSATNEEVENAAKAANAHEFIKDLDKGYKSVIGEHGVKLSGGQKQRIAIARASLADTPIIILDEATSSLDSKSELYVQEGLDRLLKDRTSIIIAHRLSTIASADYILVLSQGKIAQFGRPKELLLDQKGIYARMVALQRELLTASPEERSEKLKEFDLVE